MQAAHLDELVELEESYWWHVAKRQLALRLLQRYAPPPGRLVEGGIGSCRNLLEFREAGYDVSGFDVMPEAVELAHERGLSDVRQHDLSQPWPLDAGSVRAVVLLDVIEHIEDPVRVLQNAGETLAPGGCILVTVPAYQWLFGRWDEALGHFRRYTARRLRAEAEQAGLKVKKLTYWNAFTLPAAIAVRTCQRIRPPQETSAEFPRVSRMTNRMLLTCADAERWMIDRLPVPCGLSVVGVLCK